MPQKVTFMAPHRMEQLSRFLFFLARGGRCDHSFQHWSQGKCSSHYAVVASMVPMLSHINKNGYSNACVVYQALAIQAIHPILNPAGCTKQSLQRLDHNLVPPTKPQQLRYVFTWPWKDVDCAIRAADAVTVLMDCAKNECPTTRPYTW